LDCASIDLGRDSGASGTLTVSQSGGGTFVDALDGFVQLGLSAGASGTVNANAGYVGGKGIFVGGTSTAAGGAGVLNVAGGNVTASVNGLPNSGQCRVWNTAGSAINLSAGSLSCDTLLTSGNPALFNWTGGNLSITGTGGFSVSPTGPLGATLTINNGKQLIVSKTTTIAAGASVAVTGASAFNAGTLSGEGALSSDASFMFIGSDNTSTTFTGTITGAGGISKNGTGKLTVANTRIANLAIHSGSIAVLSTGGLPAGTSTLTSLTIDSGCKLDLTDNKLIAFGGASASSWTGTAYGGIAGLVQKGYNGGFQTGSGIVTSQTAAIKPSVLTALVTMSAADAG